MNGARSHPSADETNEEKERSTARHIDAMNDGTNGHAMERWKRKPAPSRSQAEQALIEPPLPHGGVLPPSLLKNLPFLWLVFSMGVSQIGFWAFFVAILGQASYQFHAGPFELGVLFSSFSLSFLLFTAPLGMATDRWSPKWMLVFAQMVSMGAVLIAVAGNSLAWLYVASIVDGMGAAAAIPGRGSLTGLLVEEDSLVRANGMLNTAAGFAVIIGPGVGGVIARHAGQTTAYWGIVAALGVGLLLLLPIPDHRPTNDEEPSFLADLVQGFRVSWREPPLRALMFLAGSAWFLLTVLVTLEPLLVRQVLHRGIDALGFLWSAYGAGSFLGAIAVARSKRTGRREVSVIAWSLIFSGVGYLAYVGTPFFVVAMVGNGFFGIAFAWYLSVSQALIQRVVAENMRGRVTAVIGMLQEGTALACSAAIAALAAVIVAVQPYLIGSAVAYMVSGWWGLRTARRLARRREETAPGFEREGDAEPEGEDTMATAAGVVRDG